MREPEKTIHERIKNMVKHLWDKNAVFGHGFDHAERVYTHAINLSKLEQADALTVGAAAYLIDAGLNTSSGRSDHVARGIDIAEQVITRMPELTSYRKTLIECIKYHEAETNVPHNISKEAMILHDSDTLDRMGFTGVAMTIAYGVWVKRRFCSPTDPMCIKRVPELDVYTLDYIIYIRTLVTRLLLRNSQHAAVIKLQEISEFLKQVQSRLNKSSAIDHDQARIILEIASGELQND